MPIRCAASSNFSTDGQVPQPVRPADHTEARPSPEKHEALRSELGRRSEQGSWERVLVASRCSSGLLSHWRLTKGFTAGQEQKTQHRLIARPQLTPGPQVFARPKLEQASPDIVLKRVSTLFSEPTHILIHMCICVMCIHSNM